MGDVDSRAALAGVPAARPSTAAPRDPGNAARGTVDQQGGDVPTGVLGLSRRRRARVVQRLDFLDALCRGRSVLHLGCTNAPYTEASLASGSLLHTRLAAVSGELWGLDADRQALEMLRVTGCSQLVEGDLEHLDECAIARTFDVVVAGEVIEHLSNPGLFLRGVRRLVGDRGLLVVTTVNAYCLFRLAQYAVHGTRGGNEPVHPDHVAYYSMYTLCALLQRHGWHPDERLFYDLGREHRASIGFPLRVLNAIVVRLLPQLADGVIVACR